MNQDSYGDVAESLREQEDKKPGFLVLSRGVGESIYIDSRITIKVLAVTNRQIKIGIEAPRDVRIRRAELPLADELQAFDPSSRS